MGDQPTPAQTPPTDEDREGLLAGFSESLGEILVDSHLRPHEDLWLRVKRPKLAGRGANCQGCWFHILWLSFGNRLAHSARRSVREHRV